MPEPATQTKKSFEQRAEERLKRIETRITTLSLSMGVDVPTKRPTFTPGVIAVVELPTINSSVRELLLAIPRTWTGPVKVTVGDRTIAMIDSMEQS